MEHGEGCFDETFYTPEEIDKVITLVETEEDAGHCDRRRIFVNFIDGDTYELKLEKIDKNRRCNKFYN